MAAFRRSISRILRVSLGIGLIAVAMPAYAQGEPRYRLHIPAGPMTTALAELAAATRQGIGTIDPDVARQRARAIEGEMTLRQALHRMLAGSGSRAVMISSGGWRIERDRTSRSRLAPMPAVDSPIVVAASKRATPLDRFPGAVSIVDPTDGGINRGPAGTDAVLQRTASVSSTALGAGRNKLFIRGIADSGFTGTNQSTTAQYLDDVRLTYNTPDPNLLLYDVRSVEVLEGPQGTLYGAGALGGVIRIVTEAPALDRISLSVSGGGSITAHGRAGADAAAIVNLPLKDERLALRAVGYAISEGGYIDDAASHHRDSNEVHTAGGRIAGRWNAAEGWTVDLRGIVQRTRSADSQWTFADNPPLTRFGGLSQPYRGNFTLGDLVISHDVGRARFVSSSAITQQDLSETYAGGENLGGGEGSRFRQRSETRLVAQENRLSLSQPDGSGWLIGAGIYANRAIVDREMIDVDSAIVPLQHLVQKTTEFTLFGEASLALGKGLVATTGLRLMHTHLSDQGAGYSMIATILTTDGPTPLVQGRDTRSNVHASPSLALSANLVAGLFFFARYDQGFRSGGLAIGQGIASHFRGDRLTTAETGARLKASHGELSLTFSRTRWQHVQADLVTPGGLPITTNIGNARIEAMTARGKWTPVSGMQVEAAIVANRSHLHNPAVSIIFVTDSDLPNVAHFSALSGITYERRLGEQTTLSFDARLRYIGPSRLGVGPALAVRQGDYLDTELATRLGSTSRGISLRITNLFDTTGSRFGLGTPFLLYRPQTTPLRPRTMRLGFDMRF